jgi:GntR family transcriptional regulator
LLAGGDPHSRSSQRHPTIDRGIPLPWGAAGHAQAVTVDHGSAEPVYQQVAGFLRERIQAGEFAPGRRIPSEPQIVQEYEVARETARKAVRVLVAEDLVFVVQGRGCFVKPQV